MTRSATSSSYDGAHVERLWLIRALVEGAGLSIAGLEVGGQDLDDYAAAAQAAATIDVASLPKDSPEAALRHAIIGTALLDPVLVALRRLAQEHVSSQTFGFASACPADAPDATELIRRNLRISPFSLV